ncbi:trigger factor [Desulfoluna butyratoxydans]|uniref:Trigger factor n=1 Tax=Desulfoluna butyratoxydans TaxID=231438 RepID=A0A4U8YHI5_9BACT|nr:trigger factor [Desulfoluna butyratoxydans]VFQ43036.1 trigger factor [Desulfoluna butyratoxydans]
MNFTVEDVSSVKKTLHIEVPNETVVGELDAAYNQLKKTAKVKGFRPGKAPRSVLERMYKNDVHGDVVSKLIQSALMEAIRDKEYSIIGQPELVEAPELDPAADFKFTASVELRPELGEINFKEMKITKTLYKATDEEIEAQLQMLRRNGAKREPIAEARPAADGDYAVLTYEGFKDGESFENTPLVENQQMKIGAAAMSNQFDEQLVGMNAGDEKEFEITYADTYVNSNLAGNTLTFKVKLNQILEEVLPELTDEFAKTMGPFDSIDVLREEIVKNLTANYEKRMEQELNEQIFSTLIERHEFDVPDIMIEYELDAILAEAERAFQMNGMSIEQLGKSREELRDQYRELADKQVRRHLLLAAIVQQEEMELTDEELEAGYADMAAMVGQPVDAIHAFYQANPDKIDVLKLTLLEKKAVRLIIEISDVDEVEPTLEDADAAEADEA